MGVREWRAKGRRYEHTYNKKVKGWRGMSAAFEQ